MSEGNKALVEQLVEEVWNRGNAAVVDELVAEDYVGHSSSAETETRGATGYARFFSALREGFPDIHFTIEDQIAEGDRVATRWTARGTHLGPYLGLGPTGKAGVVSGTTVYRVEDGKVFECWTNSDDLGMLQQLGLIPGPAGAH